MKNFLNKKNQNKKQQTKQDIINAAIKVIAKDGTDNSSILEITKVAKVANGTFYYHFKNKESLLDSVGEKIISEITDSYEIDWKSAKEDPAILFANATRTNLINCSQDILWLAVIIDSFHTRGKVPPILRGYNKSLVAHIGYGLSKKRYDTKIDDNLLANMQSINRNALIMISEGNSVKKTIQQAIEAKLRILGIPPKEARDISFNA
tara:strand:+ start:1364 stop:1984 length:621 start_codon:yes stop_codon:yes gene_type:complete